MSPPALDSLSTKQLRAIALDAWRRAEAVERRAEAVERRAEAAEQRAQVATTQVAALDAEVAVLLQRITELTKKLAKANHRDAQQELELELRRVRKRLADANNDLFGTKSERRSRRDKPAKAKKKHPGHGPTKQPKLPVREVVHLLDDADCTCPKCAANLRVMADQFEQTELISTVQVKYVLTVHKQQKYRCGRCGHIEAALAPKRFLPGGRYDLSFVVQVALDKYLYHLPLERQVRRMGRRGLHVTSQTLWDQLYALYLLLLPTFLALKARVLTSELLYADETTWRLMGMGKRNRSARWWMWTLTGELGTVFSIQSSRGSAAARHVLQDFAGVLMADGYSVYASLEKARDKNGGVQLDIEGHPIPTPNYNLAGCWMHARRPFIKAEKNAPVVGYALDLIGELYAIEARAREAAGDDEAALLEHRRRLRETESRRVIEELKLWRDAQRPLPGTKYADGVTYLRNQWVRLTKFLDNPLIPLDNGEAERRLRGPVVGRKNFAGSRTERGARVAELLYSLLHTAVGEGVDPVEYLVAAVITAMHNSDDTLLPHEFATQTAG